MKNFKLFKKLLVLAIVLLTWNAHAYAGEIYFCGDYGSLSDPVFLYYSKNGGSGTKLVVAGNGQSDLSLGTVSSLVIQQFRAVTKAHDARVCAVYLVYGINTSRDGTKNNSIKALHNTSGYSDWTWDSYWGVQQFKNASVDLEVLTGLAPGNYYFDYYFTMEGNTDNSENCYANCGYWSNNSGNYHMSFTVPSKTLKVQVNGTANGNTVSGTQTGVSLGTEYTITATPVAGYKFNGWTTSGGSNITIADASSATTTVTFNKLADVTVKANFVATYGFIEGRFKVKDATRSTTTYTKSDGVWQTTSTAIAMDKDNTNHRFYKHTYCTPAQLAELIGTQTGEGEKNPYFFVSASTASGSVTSPLEYWATSNSSNNDKLLAAGTAGRKAVRNTGGYAFTFMGNSTSTGYAIIYSDKDYIWYELEHDINYDANGGSGDAPTPVYFNNNTDATVGNNVYSRSGYKFKWWNKSSAGTGEDFYPGEKFNITANTDLYAVWEQVASGYAYWNGNDAGSGSPIDVTGNGITMRLTKNNVDWNTDFSKDATTVSKYSSTDKKAKVLAMDAANEYLQVHFTDGSTINSLELGTVHSGNSGTKNVVVIYSTTADFSTGEHEEVVVSIPSYTQTTKSTTDFSPSTPDKYKYARIYRSVSTAVYSYTGPSSNADKMRIYSIKAQKGCSPHGLAYASETVDKTYGDAAFTNTLTNAHSLAVSYSSGDDDVATVNNSTGEVTIAGAGSTTITATWDGSSTYCEGTASYTLNVAKASISPSLSYDETTLTAGDDSSSPTITGNSGNGTVTYVSDDTDVATVDENTGVVTAVAAGTATITATIAATDNYLGDEVSVEFTINPACSAPTSPSVSPANGWIYVPGETITFTASATGTDASTTYTWYKGPDLATAKASGAIQASKTSAQGGTTYSIASCTASDAYRYWCEISNGSGCEASASYDINIYKFYLYDDGGDDVSNSAFASIDRTNNKISVDVALEEADYTYQFKVTNGLGTWYGKDESTITSSTNYVNGLTSSGDNVGLTTTCGGCDYTIEYYYNTNNVVVTYPVAYDITHSDAENGTYTIKVGLEDAVSTSTTSFAGATITLSATGSTHYGLEAWNVTKTSGGAEVTVTDNQFTMPAEAVTIAPTFAALYTVSFNRNGASGSDPSPIEQSAVGGTITMPSAPTRTNYTFQGWMIGDAIYAAGDATYIPTANVTALAIWKQDCAGGSGTLFSQNFNSATAVAYAATTARAYTVASADNNIVGNTASSQFTSIKCASKNSCGIGLNSSTGGNSEDWTGKFGSYANNSGYGWSMVKTTNFASSAPTALMVEFTAVIDGVANTGQVMYMAVGSSFTDNSIDLPSYSNVYAGFGIFNYYNSSTVHLDPCIFGATGQGDRITTTSAVTRNSSKKYTWVINGTGSNLTYDNPNGGETTLATGKWDLWEGTTLIASAQDRTSAPGSSSISGTSMQNLYIGCTSGGRGKFVLDEITVTDLNGGSGCHYVTYDGNGATSGAVNDPKAYTAGDNSAFARANTFHREGYEFSCWNTEEDGSGTDYQEYEWFDVDDNMTLHAIWRIVIDENTSDLTAYEDVKHKDVRVTNGATLTITQDTTVRNMLVETGSTLKIATTAGDAGVKLTVKNLALAGGYGTVNNAIKYDMPRVFINSKSTLKKANSTVNFDISVTNQFSPIAVPFKVKVSDVKYAKKSLQDAATYLTHYAIKTYNGKTRAEGGFSNWNPVNQLVEVNKEYVDNYLEPGRGYILAAMREAGYPFAVIRFPMEVDDAWTAGGEKGVATISAVETTKNAVSVTAWTKAVGETLPKNKGWNILGVPYMSCFASSEAGHDQDNPYVMGKLNFITGEYTETSYAYVNVPTHDFSEYIQEKVSDAVLLPGWCFFIQFDKTGTLTFDVDGQRQTSSLPIYAPKYEQENMPIVETGIVLSGNDASDKTTIIVSDRYTAAEYEINADLEKLFGDNGYSLATYSLSGTTRLAYNAMSNADVANIIPIGYRAPADGEYTFSINPRYAESEAFEQVNLIDYETGITTNLLLNSYSFSTERTQNDARFALNVVPRKETPTDIETVGGEGINDANGPRKVLINDKMYIIIDGKMYDATGKMLK